MPNFDVKGARKAGYSDDEILSHLTQTRKFDVAGALKSGYSKPDVINHLATSAPQDSSLLQKVSDVGQLPIEFTKNVLKSGAGLASNLASTIAHPIDTISGMRDVTTGALNRVFPTMTPSDPAEAARTNAAFQAAKDFYGNRYGSLGAAAKTAWQDPVGAAMDVSMLAGGLGGAARGAGAAARMANFPRVAGVAGDVGRAAQVASEVTNPLAVAAKGVQTAGALTEAPRQAVGDWFYKKALNPGGRMEPAEAANVIETGMKERLRARMGGGYERADAITAKEVPKVAAAIKAMDEAGIPTNTTAIFLGIANNPRVQAHLKAFYSEPGEKVVSGIRESLVKKYSDPMFDETGRPVVNLLGQQETELRPTMQPSEMQAAKQAEGQVTDWRKTGEDPAATATRKGIYEGARGELERVSQLVPAAEGLPTANLRIHHVKEWQEAMKPQIMKGEGQSPMHVGGVAPAWHVIRSATGSPALGAAAGVAKGVFSYPGLLGDIGLTMTAPQLSEAPANVLRRIAPLMPIARTYPIWNPTD